MWNRERKFQPAELLGLLVLVERDTAGSLRSGQPMAWVPAPYERIPPAILVYESYRGSAPPHPSARENQFVRRPSSDLRPPSPQSGEGISPDGAREGVVGWVRAADSD